MSLTPIPPIQDALRGTPQVSLSEALAVQTGLLSAGLLTRRLGPENDGLLALGATIAAWIEWSVAAALLAWLASEPLAALLNERDLGWLPRLMALDILLFSLARACRNVLIGRGGFDGWAALTAEAGDYGTAKNLAMPPGLIPMFLAPALLILKLPAVGLLAWMVLQTLCEFSSGDIAAVRSLFPGCPSFPRNQV